MKNNRRSSNDWIRRQALKSQRTSSSMSNDDMNVWMRTGEAPIADATQTRKQVRELMSVNKTLTLAEAQEQVFLFNLNHPQDKSPVKNKRMNDFIRGAKGKTVDVKEEEEGST